MSCHQQRRLKARVGVMANKPPLNTFEEWKASKYAKQGIQCQSCHMPNRAHQWKGIHDKETTLKAISVSLRMKVDSKYLGSLSITNTGAGHHFPTYITPKIVITAYQVDQFGNRIPDTDISWTIKRSVDWDLQKETMDTRIKAGATARFLYTLQREDNAHSLRYQAIVFPDDEYVRTFLDAKEWFARNKDSKHHADAEAAFQRASGSNYELFNISGEIPK